MLSQLFRKVKTFCTGHGRELFLVAFLVVIAVASFGFGRLSALWREKEPIVIEPTSASNKAPRPTVEAASATGIVAGPPSDAAVNPTIKSQGNFVASKKGTAYHFPWCPGAKQIKEENKIWFQTKQAAAEAGYKPAGNCPGLP